MAFVSILDKEIVENREVSEPDFFQDLNLDQILNRIIIVWNKKVRDLYYYFPADLDTENYRREIYKDIKACKLFESLKEFVSMMNLYLNDMGTAERIDYKIQKKMWHIHAAVHYCNAIAFLQTELEKASTKSQGLNELKKYLKEYLSSAEYTKMSTLAHDLTKELTSTRLSLNYDGDKLVVAENTMTPEEEIKLKDKLLKDERKPLAEVDFEANLNVLFPNHESVFETPFTTSEGFSAIELELYTVLKKLKPQFFKNIEDFYYDYPDFADKVIERFHSEINFYLSFHAFTLEMNGFGFEFCAPTVDNNKEFAATGLYDLALACVSTGDHKPVISNAFNYKKDESFFVLTGPNQGGKTTFARSLGQLVFFTKMGLDVPATTANVHYFSDMLTHFSVEESVETGRGKLKEELIRLKPMMQSGKTNSFVIINELFTTAANYDASIMGKKVLEHFIELNCCGIYVTHIKELSEGHPKIVSLRAMLDENRIQSFKITRSAANDDACADNQINKHKLSYEQIKQRLAAKAN